MKTKGERRHKQWLKGRYGMKVVNRSIKTVQAALALAARARRWGRETGQ